MRKHMTCLIIIGVSTAFVPMALGQGAHGSFLGGPWEIVVGIGMDGPKLRYPISVEDETLPVELNRVIPVMGTPLKLNVTNYIPDLRFDEQIVEQPGAGVLAQVALAGPSLNQTMWLLADDPKKSSIKASVGRLTLAAFANTESPATLLKSYLEAEAPGYLTIQSLQSKANWDVIVKPGKTFPLEGMGERITVLRYLPHYSMDTQTGKIVNQSGRAVNPAVEVRVEGLGPTYTQWLWSEFPDFSHTQVDHPLQIQFRRPRLERQEHHYLLAVAPNTQPVMVDVHEGEYRIGPWVADQIYPFDEEYSFQIKAVHTDAALKKVWRNGKNDLIKPALIVELDGGQGVQEIVMTVGKPYHHKMRSGTVVFLFRQQPLEMAEPS